MISTKLTFLIIMMISLENFTQNSKIISVGDKLFNISGTDEFGKKIDISDYKEKYILLNFTATNCGPCWKTYNVMNELQSTYLNKLKIISFHADNDMEKWKSIAKELNISFNCSTIWDSKEKSKILEIYNIDGFPYFFLINKDGIIVKKWFGNQKEKLIRNLKRHLK